MHEGGFRGGFQESKRRVVRVVVPSLSLKRADHTFSQWMRDSFDRRNFYTFDFLLFQPRTVPGGLKQYGDWTGALMGQEGARNAVVYSFAPSRGFAWYEAEQRMVSGKHLSGVPRRCWPRVPRSRCVTMGNCMRSLPATGCCRQHCFLFFVFFV